MGYSTDFFGEFKVAPRLKPEHQNYLRQFAETRRMNRNAAITATRPDPIREAAGLPVGKDGAFYVGEGGHSGQGVKFGDHDDIPDLIDYNSPPPEQPGLWCQWVPNEDGTAIVWDEAEKFYNYVEWITYLIEKFLGPWGYKLNGVVEWHGEDAGDFGRITIKNNKITVEEGSKVYGKLPTKCPKCGHRLRFKTS